MAFALVKRRLKNQFSRMRRMQILNLNFHLVIESHLPWAHSGGLCLALCCPLVVEKAVRAKLERELLGG